MTGQDADHHFSKTVRGSVPVLTLLVGTVLGAVPLGIPALAFVAPFYALAGVYFWTLHRPRLVPRVAVFGVGLIQDGVTGAPLGLSSAVLLLAQSFVLGQRMVLARKSFWISWLGLALTAFSACAAAWLIASLYETALLPIGPVVLQAATTVLVYPAIAAVLAALQHRALAIP
jgi:rod shape-determining protein MreD